MQLLFERICKNEEGTNFLAEEFSKILKTGDVVCLSGNLGSGKTFFVNAICKAFNIDFVTSPTFAIVNEYGENPKIYHFDFYRIESEIELYDLGFEDYLNDSSAIVFIEWADLYTGILPKKRFTVNLEIVDLISRKISIYTNEK